MKIIIFISLLFLGINGFSQTDTIKLFRKEAIRLDSIGFQLHKIKNYTEAIYYYNQALEKDSTYGEAILNRATAIASSGSTTGKAINICEELQKAYNYGAKHVDEAAFFYGCKLKKRKKE